MFESIERIISAPINALTVKELRIQAIITIAFGIVVSLIMGYCLNILFDAPFKGCFMGFMIMHIILAVFFWFKNYLEKYFVFNSSYGIDKIYYEGRLVLLVFAFLGIALALFSIFLYENVPFRAIGVFLWLFLPIYFMFLRRDGYYNENGKLAVKNDYELAYNFKDFYLMGLCISIVVIGKCFWILEDLITFGCFSWAIILCILIAIIIVYCAMAPDFWNRYLPFDIKKDWGFIAYLVIWAIIIYSFYFIMVIYW